MEKLANIIPGEKITERVRSSQNLITQKVIQIVSEIDYDVKKHRDHTFDLSKPIFTLIITIYDANIDYIKYCLESAFAQTYPNTEVVIVNNGAYGAVGDLIWDYFLRHSNAKLIHVKNHLYNPTAEILHDPIINLWNSALFCSVGDFAYFLSYDDSVSKNYVEKMVKLFEENKECNTAAPLVLSMNERNEINQDISQIFKERNQRTRYTKGVDLALDYIRSGNKIIFPGGLLATRSHLIISCGGFDCMNDLSQLFKFAVHGESGFDPDAQLFWRHHSAQANKLQTKLGLVYYKSHMRHHEVYGMRDLHLKLANKAFADEYENYLERESRLEALNAFRKSYRISISSGLSALIRIFQECPPLTVAMATYYTIADLPIIIFYDRLVQSRTVRILYRKIRGRSTVGL